MGIRSGKNFTYVQFKSFFRSDLWKYRKYREHLAMVQSSDESDFIFILWEEIPLPDQIIGSKNFTSKKVNFTIFSELGNAKMIYENLTISSDLIIFNPMTGKFSSE